MVGIFPNPSKLSYRSNWSGKTFSKRSGFGSQYGGGGRGRGGKEYCYFERRTKLQVFKINEEKTGIRPCMN